MDTILSPIPFIFIVYSTLEDLGIKIALSNFRAYEQLISMMQLTAKVCPEVQNQVSQLLQCLTS